MNPILFKVGSVNVYTHGVFLAFAVLFAGFCLYLLAKYFRSSVAPVLDLVIYSALFGIIGARVAYIITYYHFINSPLDSLKIWEGGLVSWGGFVMGIVAYMVVIKIYKENILEWFDMLIVVAMLGVAIGRLGCFLSGELYGQPYTGFLSIRGIFPVTLFEAFLALIIFAITAFLFVRSRRSDGDYPGFVFLEGLMLFAGTHFVLDFLRSGEKIFRYFNYNQLAELIVFIAAIIAFNILVANVKKGGQNAHTSGN